MLGESFIVAAVSRWDCQPAKPKEAVMPICLFMFESLPSHNVLSIHHAMPAMPHYMRGYTMLPLSSPAQI